MKKFFIPSHGNLTTHITIVHPKVERGHEDQGLAALMRSRSGQQDSKPTVLVEPPSWSGIKLGKTVRKKSKFDITDLLYRI